MTRPPATAAGIAALVLMAGLATPAARPSPPAQTAPVLLLDMLRGQIEIELFPSEAPKSVAHVLELVKTNFYRGLRVHWVQPGVVQFGDPLTRDMTKQDDWGRGGSGNPVGVAEPSKRPFVRGSVGLAYRSNQAPPAADSQIFILRGPNPALNGKYAQIGRVTTGLDVLDKIELTDRIKNVTLKSGS